ncbi:MAG: hypothetical protein MPW14_19980 [Candidatus Manganitrophus sp.]|nr:MAG: hypothetical protein MPW14_19980 [Candidatus Manganitrophus sp.]
MAGAVGINTTQVDRLTFALGCGIAGMAGAAFTTIASTGPTTGSLYIVDTFLVVVFGGRGEPARHHRLGLRHRPGAVDPGVLHDQLDGQGAHPAGGRDHSDAAARRAVRGESAQITTRRVWEPAMMNAIGQKMLGGRSGLVGLLLVVR